ncbi:hypothetical protein B0H14DRAFT_3857118 [Mycena olivaceomarginata]|nr:hypothetical protein B0H14DRAFT_3857118 [Mycena olivaceomarginata]
MNASLIGALTITICAGASLNITRSSAPTTTMTTATQPTRCPHLNRCLTR